MTQKYNSHKISVLPLEALIPYARNARTHSEGQVAQIAGSLREFGWTNPVLVDADNSIIAGHGRVMAARKLGMTEVPCIRLTHLSEAQKRAYIIADNKLALNAGWDEKMLALELADLREADFDLSLAGFNAEEIEAALNPPGPDGMSDAYLASGTYVKSFYSVMIAPSFAKVSVPKEDSQQTKTIRRIHHRISWNNAVPKILDGCHKK